MASEQIRFADEARETLAAAEEKFAALTREMEAMPATVARGGDMIAHREKVAELTERWERARVWLTAAKRNAARRGIITASMGVTLDEARAYLRAAGRHCTA